MPLCNGRDTRWNIPRRESGQTSDGSLLTREFGEPTKTRKQMATEVRQSVDASVLVNGEWHATNWQAVSENVRRLQARIVKATKASQWRKVKSLQHLLTHSFSGKALAVRRVTENDGKKTPGVDKVLWDTPEKKREAVGSLTRRGYQPLPLRRVYIPKSNGKRRPLGIPTMKDRAMQALYLLALDPIAETTADKNSYGFRKERCCADAMEQGRNLLHFRRSATWVLEGDIARCFDKISHDWLLAHVPMDKAILQKWLKSGYLDKSVFYKTDEGAPQGGIISPVLSNLALDGLERRLREKFPLTGKGFREGRKALVNLVRYADDFLITGKSKELLENEVKPLVEQFLKERGLELSSEKTVITHIEDGFDFLGQTTRKFGNTCLTRPSKKNVKTFLQGLRKVIKENKAATPYALIALLNPKIRGWANFHRHAASSKTFVAVDAHLFQSLWQWAKRRHPAKSRDWIKRKYFATVGQRDWRFFGERTDDTGQRSLNWLRLAASTPIRRHTKIKGDANPYDPTWEVYFEERLGLKMEANLRGRRQLSRLWREQKGICPVCNQLITKLTGWHNHHIVKRVLGGSDRNENRVLLHPECHRQVHSQNLSVSKPRPVTRA